MNKAKDDPSFAAIVWGQFRKRRLAYAALWMAATLFLLAVYAPLIAESRPFFWQVDGGPLRSPWLAGLFDRNVFQNTLDLFFNALMLPGSFFAVGLLWWWRHTRTDEGRRKQRRRRAGAIGCLCIFAATTVAIVLSARSKPIQRYPGLAAELQASGHRVRAVFAPLPYAFRDVDINAVREDPSPAHPLGTDDAGRDVFVRLLYGTRVSLTVGLFAVALYISIGTFLGALAGYFGGRVDSVISRAIEVVLSIPSLFLILTVAAFIEQRSIFHVMLIIAAVSWTTPARLVRAEFLRLRNLDFVTAARAAGFSKAQIMFRQILPNALGPVLVTATFGVASAILTESTMSFLGLGDMTLPSWGQILNTGRTTQMWTLILAPGFAIFVTVSVLNLIGDGLRDALDPKQRQ